MHIVGTLKLVAFLVAHCQDSKDPHHEIGKDVTGIIRNRVAVGCIQNSNHDQQRTRRIHHNFPSALCDQTFDDPDA